MTERSGAHIANVQSGRLGARPLVALLGGAHGRSASGTFTFDHPGGRASLTMRGGRIAAVRTSQPIAYLGAVLWEQGAIDDVTLNETLAELARTRSLHGRILLERGCITEKQLDEALVEQTRRQAHYLFSLPDETQWSFRINIDDLTGERDEGRPTVDPWPVMWRGISEHPPTQQARAALLRVESGMQLRAGVELRRFGFSADERAVCERLAAQPQTVANLVATSSLSPLRTELIAYLLGVTGSLLRIQLDARSPMQLGREGVIERARTIENEDPYTVLGLARGASPEAARAAFFRLARVWHPDRLPEGFPDDARPACELVFSRIADAHRLLTALGHQTNLASRDLRDVRGSQTSQASIPRDPIPPPTAKVTLRDVDRWLGRGDLERTVTAARELVNAGNDGPTARAIIAWCEAEAGAAPPLVLSRAVGQLDRILSGDPECERALLYRGQLAKRLGNVDAAMRDFRKLARLAPDDIEAVRELRIHEMRSRNGGGERKSIAMRTPPSRPAFPALDTSDPARTKIGVIPEPNTTEDARARLHSGLRRLLARVIRK